MLAIICTVTGSIITQLLIIIFFLLQDQVTNGIERAEHKVYASAEKVRASLDAYKETNSYFQDWIRLLAINNRDKIPKNVKTKCILFNTKV